MKETQVKFSMTDEEYQEFQKKFVTDPQGGYVDFPAEKMEQQPKFEGFWNLHFTNSL